MKLTRGTSSFQQKDKKLLKRSFSQPLDFQVINLSAASVKATENF